MKANKDIKHIVCFSGGHSSALVAIEVVKTYGKENVILVNHECKLEPDDVGRFENEVADYLEMKITYVNFIGFKEKDQFDVSIDKGAFLNPNDRQMLCTHVMKTKPFMDWLSEFFPDGESCIIYYGFDKSETARVQRRSTIMGAHNYKTQYPLYYWHRSLEIVNTEAIGIMKPNTYKVFKHANCIGCLKAGWQHWYCVYVLHPDIYDKAILTEQSLGYSIHRDKYLSEMVEKFDLMVNAGVEPTEHIQSQKFWSMVKKQLIARQIKMFDDVDFSHEIKPCECSF